MKKNSVADLHIVWIDNGSSPEEHRRVLEYIQSFDYSMEYHPEPLGFPKAMNRGLLHIREKYTVFLNNDVEVNPGWDQELIAAVNYRPGIAGPMAIDSVGFQDTRKHRWLNMPDMFEDKAEKAAWLRQNWAFRGQDMVMQAKKNKGFKNVLAFFCVLLPTALVKKIGAFDERFGWGYCEDDDYCIRAIRLGYNITLCPGATVLHENGQTLKKVSEDKMMRLRRNQAYLLQKWKSKAEG